MIIKMELISPSPGIMLLESGKTKLFTVINDRGTMILDELCPETLIRTFLCSNRRKLEIINFNCIKAIIVFVII